MKKQSLATVALCAAIGFPSCATVHSVRWSYGINSIYEKPDELSEKIALRATVGFPLIVTAIAFDVVTCPIQLMFGVWPMWGEASQHMKPPTTPPS